MWEWLAHSQIVARCVWKHLEPAEIISTRLSYHRLQRKSNSPKKKSPDFLATFFVEKSSGSMQWCYTQIYTNKYLCK